MAGGDALALLAFAAVGRINHGGVADWETLYTAAPFVLGMSVDTHTHTCAHTDRDTYTHTHTSVHKPCVLHVPCVRAGWFLTAPFLGGYGPEAQGGKVGPAALAAAKCWAVATPLGLVLRGLSKGYVPPTPFIVVSMGTCDALNTQTHTHIERHRPTHVEKYALHRCRHRQYASKGSNEKVCVCACLCLCMQLRQLS